MNLTNQPVYQKGTKRRRVKSKDERDDAEFLEWIRKQPSCISGQFSEYLPNGEGRCVAAHVRRAGEAGTAFKPLFSAVPLTDAEHKLTHQHGDDVLRPKKWWDAQRRLYLKRWRGIQLIGFDMGSPDGNCTVYAHRGGAGEIIIDKVVKNG